MKDGKAETNFKLESSNEISAGVFWLSKLEETNGEWSLFIGEVSDELIRARGFGNEWICVSLMPCQTCEFMWLKLHQSLRFNALNYFWEVANHVKSKNVCHIGLILNNLEICKTDHKLALASRYRLQINGATCVGTFMIQSWALWKAEWSSFTMCLER